MLLTIDIGRTENKLPSGKIIFNNNIIHSGEYNKNTFTLPQIVGTNELSISLDNKQDKDTTMKGNQIVKDVYIVVKDLRCEITDDSLNAFDTIGTYITDRNENLKTFGYLSYNGTYKFVFDYPFFVFKKKKLFYQ